MVVMATLITTGLLCPAIKMSFKVAPAAAPCKLFRAFLPSDHASADDNAETVTACDNGNLTISWRGKTAGSW